jgi:hypothetical protein
VRSRDLEKIGREYRETHNGFLPDRVRRSGRKQKRKTLEMLGDGCGWLPRLAMAGDELRFFTVALAALDLEHLEHESNMYSHEAVNSIKDKIREVMPSAFWARLEVGNRERKLHVHLFAHNAPAVSHNGQETQSLGGIASYVCKCPVPDDDLSAGVFIEAQKQSRAAGHKRLPNITFRRGIPNS